MTSSNLLELARARESVIGVTPASPRLFNAFVRSETLTIDKRFLRDDTIIGGRLVNEHIPVGIAVSGSTPVRVARGYLDWVLELAFMNAFSNTTEEQNGTAGEFISDVTGATKTFTTAEDYVEGQLFETSGFAAAANNGRDRAASGSGANTLVATTIGTVNDANPQAGARIKVVGIQAAGAGDITATAEGLASSTTDFTTFPNLKLNVPINVGGENASTQFAFGRVQGLIPTLITANAVTLAGKPSTWAVDSAAAKSIQIFTPDEADIGNAVITDVMQKVFKGQASPIYYGFNGIACQSLSLGFTAGELADAGAEIVGFTGGKLVSPIDATVESPTIGAVMQCGTSVGRLLEGDADIALDVACQSLTFRLQNNLTPINSLGYDRAVGWNLGDADLVIEGDYLFGNGSLVDKFLDVEESSQLIFFGRGKYAYALRCYGLTYTAAPFGAPGRNQQARVQMRGEGKRDGVSGRMLSVFRFEAWK